MASGLLFENGTIAAAAMKEPFSPEVIARFQAHPNFAAIIRDMSQTFIELFEGNRIVNLLSNDRGRVHVGHAILYLHHMRDPADPSTGLTPSRLKAFCSDNGMCSAGRAATILTLMKMSGYVEAGSSVNDRRYRILVPTQKLLHIFRGRWRASFSAVEKLAPETSTIALAAAESEDFAAVNIRILSNYFIDNVRIMNHAPALAPFTEANAGLLVMMSLFVEHYNGERKGDGAIVRTPISALARRFGVSRAHVKQVLRNAQNAGLLRVEGGGGTFIPDATADAIRDMFAYMLAFELHCAIGALAAVQEARKSASVRPEGTELRP